MPGVGEVTDFVLNYVRDIERCYAMAIVGEWGSGKTRYVDTILRKALDDNGNKLVRVSMFGLSSVEELFERVLEAFAKIPGNDDNIKKWRKEAIVEGLKGILSKRLKESGVSYQASAKLVASFICNEKTVVVFDDAERTSPSINEKELYGAINNLVENQGCRVIFVTNSLAAIGEEIREKLVWRAIYFEPDVREVIEDVFGDLVEVREADGALEQLESAALDVGCRNVRAMIKAMPLVRMALSSPVTASDEYASENIGHALREILGFAFEASMGRAPSDPELKVDASTEDKVAWTYEKMRYERYKDVEVVARFFDPSSIIVQADVDSSIDQYMKRRYPESSDELEMKLAVERLRGCTLLDDEVVAPRIARLAESLKKARFDPYDLVSALKMNDYLFKLGFSEAATPEEAMQCACELIDFDPERAYVRFHRRYATWGGANWNDCETLRKADEYCVKQHDDAMQERYVEALDFGDPLCGKVMAEQLEEMREKDYVSLFEVPSSEIAKCFACGNAVSQNELHDFIKRLGYMRFGDGELQEAQIMWLKSLENEFSLLEFNSRMGLVRKGWVLEALQSTIKDLGSDVL